MSEFDSKLPLPDLESTGEAMPPIDPAALAHEAEPRAAAPPTSKRCSTCR